MYRIICPVTEETIVSGINSRHEAAEQRLQIEQQTAVQTEIEWYEESEENNE